MPHLCRAGVAADHAQVRHRRDGTAQENENGNTAPFLWKTWQQGVRGALGHPSLLIMCWITLGTATNTRFRQVSGAVPDFSLRVQEVLESTALVKLCSRSWMMTCDAVKPRI